MLHLQPVQRSIHQSARDLKCDLRLLTDPEFISVTQKYWVTKFLENYKNGRLFEIQEQLKLQQK